MSWLSSILKTTSCFSYNTRYFRNFRNANCAGLCAGITHSTAQSCFSLRQEGGWLWPLAVILTASASRRYSQANYELFVLYSTRPSRFSPGACDVEGEWLWSPRIPFGGQNQGEKEVFRSQQKVRTESIFWKNLFSFHLDPSCFHFIFESILGDALHRSEFWRNVILVHAAFRISSKGFKLI